MKKVPSEKQSKYVRDIIRWLGKEPPHEFSAAAYYQFIRENIDELKKFRHIITTNVVKHCG